jgi:hypothetical protein
MQIDDCAGWNIGWLPRQPRHGHDLALVDDQADLRIVATVLDIDNMAFTNLTCSSVMGAMLFPVSTFIRFVYSGFLERAVP